MFIQNSKISSDFQGGRGSKSRKSSRREEVRERKLHNEHHEVVAAYLAHQFQCHVGTTIPTKITYIDIYIV
jgi:hypothetical protein